jgi:hypothetical protein
MQGKGWINRGEPFHKVLFKSSDGSFSGVAAVTVGRYQLVFHIIGGEKVLQSRRRLVFESLEFWFESLGNVLLVDVIICFDPFGGRLVFHWDDLNVVAVINIADHDI